MISNQWLFFAVVTGIIVTVKLCEKWTKSRFFEFVPSVVIIYFTMMVFANTNLFAPDVSEGLEPLKNILLSSMIFLLLSKANLRGIGAIKGRLLISFFVVSATIMTAFVIVWIVFKAWLPPDAYKAFGALCGTWIGGTANMIAVAGAVGLHGDLMGYCLITDSINYAIWLMFLLAVSSYAHRFDSWTKAKNLPPLAQMAKESSSRSVLNILTICSALCIAFFVPFVAQYMPHGAFANKSFWIVVISTILGIAASFSPLSKNSIASVVGFWLLYFLISFVAAGSSFSDFSKAPLFVAAGFSIIVVHALLAVLYAKVFRINLFTIGVASLANIGGIASAPLLAASFSENLVGVGVLMSMLGYIIGTFCGIALTYLLALL